MKKILVMLGPTATGKTDQALILAKRFNGELVSCDSRQVYVGLDIGTGKYPNGKWTIENGQLKKRQRFWEIDGVKIWMYDVCDPKIQYTVFDYVKDAEKIIEDIIKRDKLPIIVGGTGLYLKGLLEGFFNMTIPVDKEFRKVLEKLDKSKLQKRLQKISLAKWSSLNESDRQNPRRLIRAIELISSSLRGAKQRSNLDEKLPRPLGIHNDVFKLGLTALREVLYKKVDLRVLTRIGDGMIDEAIKLHNKGLTFESMRRFGLEYGCLADFLEDKIKSREELIKILQGKIHAYVRRQLTWFKKMEKIEWFDVSDKSFPIELEKKVSKWYYSKYAQKD